MSTLEDVRNIQKSMNQYILDQEDIIEKVILSLLCSGNILLEGAPGTGKTRTIKTLATLLESSLGRIQFTQIYFHRTLLAQRYTLVMRLEVVV